MATCRWHSAFSDATCLDELLLKYGADADAEKKPLFKGLVRCILNPPQRFPQLLLDCFFLHRGNINMEHGYHHTALAWAIIIETSNSNRVRWYIRHGADTSPKVNLLNKSFIPSGGFWFPNTPLILLQAGMRVSRGAQTQLSNMETAISTWLQDDTLGTENIETIIDGIWDHIKEAEEEEIQTVQRYRKKTTFPEYWTQQMADLQEFSDESLQVYPEETPTEVTYPQFQKTLDQIHRVLEFLSQPQSLQWHCRRYVRENLVSLQPSVVKTLPGPANLKCYILCHEI